MSVGPWEILAILLVVLLLFGARKLPELARSVGRSARIFKSEVNEMKEENNSQQPQQGQLPQRDPANDDFWNDPANQPTQYQQPQQGYGNPQQPGQ
ncbi:Sec-independent protein translocase subunit TatA [Corynebacterium incognita]|uniref:Sec-independent protein translocase protein TatA n=1 Tax=Corynebacterium incognita TaxID=2754725 RepID=A0A7G7CPN8_9CORY|nr:Sec-independent protein translocase subunit TatA [Corynebacterium incognita]QNE89554.1 Sec-independent protein translocase subunit TatA [Corynebacterium incognita]